MEVNNCMYSTVEKSNFLEMVNSLKLAQRAELWSGEENLISMLYVDPLPSDGVFTQLIQDNTVFLIGRKGTGKSTIFARVQEHFRASKNEISVYVDVKTVYGKALPDSLWENDFLLTLSLYENFIKEVITELFAELEHNLNHKNRMYRLWKKKDYINLLNKLKEIKNKITNVSFKDITTIKNVNVSEIIGGTKEQSASVNGNTKGGPASIEYSAEAAVAHSKSDSIERGEEFSSILIREFNLKDFINDITEALKEYGINKLHIILDDFSEVDMNAQKVFVDTILSPLNNWSNKYIRFKVAGYPNRVFYGDIDKGKIDEIQLDYYNLYPSKDLPELESKAIEFLNRLLITRFNHYLTSDFYKYFAVDDSNNKWDDLLKLLFHTSMNIPRVLGHILNYCYKSAILYNQRISKRLIEEASQQYYENQIKYYFEKTNYLREAHGEKLDRFSQEQLLNTIIERAKHLKSSLKNENNEMFKNLPIGKIPTSHFYINKELESFLHTLELNYFVNKYYEQSDRDGKVSSIYSLNYGLCMEHNIIFGRPEGDTKYRKYYISRHFNNSEVLQKFLIEQKKFVCSNCSYEYEFSYAETLKQTEMLCFKGCYKPNCVVEENKFNNAMIFDQIKINNLLPEIELEILHIIKQNADVKLYASLIARELDCSHQLISKRTFKLEEAGLIVKLEEVLDGKTRRIYKLTDKAIKIYFNS